VYRIIEVESNDAEQLARFVEAAQRSRPRAWRHVERLKSVCALTTSTNPELRDLLRRLWRLESELESLTQQSRLLRGRLEQSLGTTRKFVASAPAANAADYADSGSADERVTP
jgi:hypothetical protein